MQTNEFEQGMVHAQNILRNLYCLSNDECEQLFGKKYDCASKIVKEISVITIEHTLKRFDFKPGLKVKHLNYNITGVVVATFYERYVYILNHEGSHYSYDSFTKAGEDWEIVGTEVMPEFKALLEALNNEKR